MQRLGLIKSVLSNPFKWMLASPMGEGNGENGNGERESGDLVDENGLKEELRKQQKEGWVW